MAEKADPVEDAKRRCACLVDAIGRLPPSIAGSCRRTILKLAESELSFLSRRASSSSSSSDSPLSVNIGHLEAVVHILRHLSVTGVSRVCKPIPLLPASGKAWRTDSGSKIAHVDIVCTLKGIPVWIIISDRNPKYVSWHDGHKGKGLRLRIQQVVDAAQSSAMLRPSSIILFFSRGVTDCILKKIVDEFQANEYKMEADFPLSGVGFLEEMEGEWINIIAKSYKESVALEIKVDNFEKPARDPEWGVGESILGAAETDNPKGNVNLSYPTTFDTLISGLRPSMKGNDMASTKTREVLSGGDLINFDTTAIIALVSDISNGGAEKLLNTAESELSQRFKGNLPFVIAQANSEIWNPILPELGAVICGKNGVICESVLSEFQELIAMYGGTKEKLRADQILKWLIVVPDNPSDRMIGLPTTRKLAKKNKVVFGTGDYWHAPTLTANMAFVRAVSQTGMSLHTIEHRPRALTGN
ncbi:hypothetical protein BT93_C1893 [Corymbia citriodora subsp. variegata]|nr:hypothetical protein BT93_C1893 [Corymbia citriodora subsp. variegata]